MKIQTLAVLLLFTPPLLGAQAAAPVVATPSSSSARSSNADLQPAVNTSSTAASVNPKPDAAAKSAPKVSVPTTSTLPAARRTTANATPAVDRLELDTTQITGNRELPRVLYVVPWKRSDLGDLTGRPANSLLDEVLAPVDRDVFRRQNRYYDALRPDTGKVGASGAAEVEK
jgi:hypothetical protein